MKMSKSDLLKGRFFKASDLEGKSLPVTIVGVEEELVGLPGQQEKKPVLYVEQKSQGLILNKTNARVLIDLFGDDTENWTGENIVYFPDRASHMGKIYDVVRIRAVRKGEAGHTAGESPPPPSPPPAPPTAAAEIDDEVPFTL
jgi:hypothetical protein